MKRLFSLIAIVLVLFCVVQIHKAKVRYLDRFLVNNVTTSLMWNLDFNEGDPKEAYPILRQRFFYLARGSQAYVFESEDGKYVLKLLKQNVFRKPFWEEDKFCNKSQIKNLQRDRLLSALSCYKLSYEKAKEETATLFMHLNKKRGLFQKVNIVDRIGRVHKIDLSEIVFVLQKKAVRISEVLRDLVHSKDTDKLKKLFKNYINLERRLLHCGIKDADPAIRNLALLGDRLIKIDGGQFFILDERVSKRDILLANMEKMRRWLKEHNNCVNNDIVASFDHLVKEELKKW